MSKTSYSSLIILCLFLIASSLHAQSEQHTGRILKNIRSANQAKFKTLNIKSVSAYDCDVDVEKTIFTCRYDTNGCLIDSIGYPQRDMKGLLKQQADAGQLDPSSYENGEIIEYKFHYVYNAKGLRTQIAMHMTERAETTTALNFSNDTTTYTYDSEDKLVRAVSKNRNGVMIQEDTYSYDTTGNLASWKQFKSGSPRNFTNQYTYDAQNNLVEYYRADVSGEFAAREKCTYDQNGNLLTWENIAKSGVTIYKKNFVYDNYGDMVESTGYIGGDNFDSKLEKSYDNTGKVIETVFSSGRITGRGNFVFKDRIKESFFYDTNNNLTQKDTYDIKGDKTLSEIYYYDNNGSLTRISLNPGPCTQLKYEYNKK